MAEAGKDVRRQYDELAFENFFQRFNLLDIKDTFVENGFRTCRSLMIVTDDELKEIGIGSLGLRKEVLGAIAEWKKPILQRASNTGPDRNIKTTTSNAPSAFSSTPSYVPSRSPPDFKQSPLMHSTSSGQFTPPVLSRVKDTPSSQGSPAFHPGGSPTIQGAEKFHRIRRNESCPYPECTWAGLSTHFHCLVCSSFHTNKTERIRRHIQRHEGAENANDLDEYQKVKREQFFIFGGKECPEQCKYSEQGVRHLHCKHCDWRTKKMERVRKHLKAHDAQPYDAEANRRQEEYYQVKERQFTIFNKFCPEICKYALQGIRHIHCKHCEWKTQKFDSRLLAHFKSHHERHLPQYQGGQDIGSPTTTMANIRTVSPLPTMAVQEAVQIADAQVASHDGTSLPKPPKLLKMETPDGEGAVAVHIQPGGYLNQPGMDTEDADEKSSTSIEGDMSPQGKCKCMVCGERWGLRTALMREQKGRNGPIDWNKTKQLFAYHRTKSSNPSSQWICQKHIEEFVYFSRAYLSIWNTAGVHHQSHSHQSQHQHSEERSQDDDGEVTESTLVSGMPVYMMLNEHLNEHYKQGKDGVAEEEAVERE